MSEAVNPVLWRQDQVNMLRYAAQQLRAKFDPLGENVITARRLVGMAEDLEAEMLPPSLNGCGGEGGDGGRAERREGVNEAAPRQGYVLPRGRRSGVV